MAHEIRKHDHFAFTGERSMIWHGIGTPIEDGLDAVTAFQQTGLGWPTELQPVFRKKQVLGPDGKPLLDEKDQPQFEMVEVSDHFMHVRPDLDLELGMVSDGYRPFENVDLARFADALAGEDAAVTVSTCGSLYDCRRIFVLVKLPQIVKATAEDISEQYVCISNGHGGFASFSVYPTSIRVVCANTLRWSERDAGRGIRFRHTGDFDEKVKMARTVLGTAQKETERFQEQVTALVKCQLSVDQTRHFMERAWEIAYGKLSNLEGEALAKMVVRRDNQVEEWIAMMENERNSMPGIEGTAWSALNAVTEFHDHSRGRFKTVAESQARVHSNLFGTSAVAKTRTLRAALALVK